MEPRRSSLAPGLERWAQSAAPAERRTVVVRFGPAVGSGHAADELQALGAEVQQRGAASVSCQVSPSALRELATRPWVLAVEEPRRLFPTNRG